MGVGTRRVAETRLAAAAAAAFPARHTLSNNGARRPFAPAARTRRVGAVEIRRARVIARLGAWTLSEAVLLASAAERERQRGNGQVERPEPSLGLVLFTMRQ